MTWQDIIWYDNEMINMIMTMISYHDFIFIYLLHVVWCVSVSSMRRSQISPGRRHFEKKKTPLSVYLHLFTFNVTTRIFCTLKSPWFRVTFLPKKKRKEKEGNYSSNLFNKKKSKISPWCCNFFFFYFVYFFKMYANSRINFSKSVLL